MDQALDAIACHTEKFCCLRNRHIIRPESGHAALLEAVNQLLWKVRAPRCPAKVVFTGQINRFSPSFAQTPAMTSAAVNRLVKMDLTGVFRHAFALRLSLKDPIQVAL
jgi:hypothetical protein